MCELVGERKIMTPTDLLNKWIAEARKEYEIAKIEQNLYKMKRFHHIIDVILELKSLM